MMIRTLLKNLHRRKWHAKRAMAERKAQGAAKSCIETFPTKVACALRATLRAACFCPDLSLVLLDVVLATLSSNRLDSKRNHRYYRPWRFLR
jgi:hypothetical protein